jgi:hypothetical protein
MSLLFSVLRDAFVIWSRSFALIYVFFLFILVASLILGPAGPIGWNARSLVLGVLLILILSAFMAGLYYMIEVACRRFLGDNAPEALPSGKREAVRTAFSLFRDFLPGVGAFFVPVAVGILIQTGVLLGLIGWGLSPLGTQLAPFLERLTNLAVTGGTATPESLLPALSPERQATLGLTLLGSILACVVFGVVTMLWPVFVVMYRENPLTAYGRSIRQFFRDPFRLLALSALFAFGETALSLLIVIGGVLGEIFGRLASLLLQIYLMISLFVYAWSTIGPPSPLPAEDDEPPEEPTPPEETPEP